MRTSYPVAPSASTTQKEPIAMCKIARKRDSPEIARKRGGLRESEEEGTAKRERGSGVG